MKSTQFMKSWKELLVGQDQAIEKITPYIIRAQANLNSKEKPVGTFFLMGPSGVGKTKTAETLAELMHGNERSILRVDCGEFQLEHEIAKLVGSPPGYLGHKDTQPIFTQQKINSIASEKCTLSIVLFDEIEKAHRGFFRVLLGILDKATLKLGDNSVVNFEKTIIFLSSNLGAKEISDLLEPSFGFTETNNHNVAITLSNQKAIEKIGLGAMGKTFPPEFQNRINEIISYKNLPDEILTQITVLELQKLQNHLNEKLSGRSFNFTYDKDTIDFLTFMGTNVKYGARELKRVMDRFILNPLADDYIEDKIPARSTVHCKVVNNDHIEWDITELEIEPHITENTTGELAMEAQATPQSTTSVDAKDAIRDGKRPGKRTKIFS